MPNIMLIRAIHMPPGNRERTIEWIRQTEAVRRQMGQVSQYFTKGITDPNEYLFIQVWESLEAYHTWKQSPERQRLATERQRLLTHGPVEFYEVL
jgi:heme-degrading monooxygenase HmoA